MAKTDRVAQFLYDINVELNLNYADPSRDLFPEFAPHYAQYPDLPVASRLTAALGKLANPAEVLKVQGVVTAALMRVTESALGHARSLIVLDLAHEICPENFSADLWSRLLTSQSALELPLWLQALAFRLERWDINVALPKFKVLRAIDCVAPTGLEVFARWALRHRAVDVADSSLYQRCLMKRLTHRLEHHHDEFARAQVDVIATLDRLVECVRQQNDAAAADDPTHQTSRVVSSLELLELRRLPDLGFGADLRHADDLPLAA